MTSKQEALEALDKIAKAAYDGNMSASRSVRLTDTIRQHIEQPDIDLEGMMLNPKDIEGVEDTWEAYDKGYNQALKDVKEKIGGGE